MSRGLTVTQDRLLVRALDMLKPGGTLVYAVCSLQEDEGVERINALLVRDASAKTRTRRRPPNCPASKTPSPHAATSAHLPFMWADRGGLDGFYVARLTTA